MTISGTISRHGLSYALTKRSTSATHGTELWRAFRKNRIRGPASVRSFSFSFYSTRVKRDREEKIRPVIIRIKKEDTDDVLFISGLVLNREFLVLQGG